MKRLLAFAALLVGLGCTGEANAQKRPKVNTKRAFSHQSEAGERKSNRAQFRRPNNIRPVIDLHPRSQTQFKTAKAGKDYKFSSGR